MYLTSHPTTPHRVTSNRVTSNPRRARIALVAGVAAAGLALLSGCGEETRASSPASTAPPPASAAPHTAHSTPVATAPVETGPAQTAPTTAPATSDPATVPATTVAVRAPSQIEVTTTDFGFELSSDVVAAGSVTFALTNHGSEPHQLHVAAVPEGFTAQDFIDSFDRDGELAAFQSFTWSGGVNGTEPGATEVATAELAAGHYVMLCLIPNAGEHGASHVSLGMVSQLDVVDTGARADEPIPVATVELTDFAIAIPERFTGGVVEVINNGSQNHELILMRFDEGKTIADLLAWSAAGMPAERPFDYVGGTGTLAPSTRGWATLTLESGDYLALCVVRGPSDQPHVDLGMATPFSVA